jgi:ADP-ribose pyrophosphatase YjhB (NUDIX family)
VAIEYDYPRPDLCVEVFVVDVDDVLLLLRNDDPCIGQWGGPGGHVEPGETLADAAARETTEETGLVLARQIVMGSHVEQLEGDDRLVVAIMARVDDLVPVRLTSEHRASRWCRDNSLPRPITEWRCQFVRRALSGATLLG